LELSVLIRFRCCCFVTVWLMREPCSVNERCLSFFSALWFASAVQVYGADFQD